VTVRKRRFSARPRLALSCVSAAALLLIAAMSQMRVAAKQRTDQEAKQRGDQEAKQRAEDPRARIRSEVSLVGTLASVLDKDGRPALDLSQDQFDVYEEGVKQKIEIFEPETKQALDLTLMIDSSLSE